MKISLLLICIVSTTFSLQSFAQNSEEDAFLKALEQSEKEQVKALEANQKRMDEEAPKLYQDLRTKAADLVNMYVTIKKERGANSSEMNELLAGFQNFASQMSVLSAAEFNSIEGEIRLNMEEYQKQNPGVSYEELESTWEGYIKIYEALGENPTILNELRSYRLGDSAEESYKKEMWDPNGPLMSYVGWALLIGNTANQLRTRAFPKVWSLGKNAFYRLRFWKKSTLANTAATPTVSGAPSSTGGTIASKTQRLLNGPLDLDPIEAELQKRKAAFISRVMEEERIKLGKTPAQIASSDDDLRKLTEATLKRHKEFEKEMAALRIKLQGDLKASGVNIPTSATASPSGSLRSSISEKFPFFKNYRLGQLILRHPYNAAGLLLYLPLSTVHFYVQYYRTHKHAPLLALDAAYSKIGDQISEETGQIREELHELEAEVKSPEFQNDLTKAAEKLAKTRELFKKREKLVKEVQFLEKNAPQLGGKGGAQKVILGFTNKGEPIYDEDEETKLLALVSLDTMRIDLISAKEALWRTVLSLGGKDFQELQEIHSEKLLPSVQQYILGRFLLKGESPRAVKEEIIRAFDRLEKLIEENSTEEAPKPPQKLQPKQEKVLQKQEVKNNFLTLFTIDLHENKS